MTERSCGTIPYTVRGGKLFYLLVKAKDDGPCGFPKGHVEDGESEIETALRETLEATSLRPIISDSFRYEISYDLKNGNQKTVVYFLADFGDQTPARNGDFEDFEYLILPFSEAYDALTFDNTKQMLKAADERLTGKRK
jgi:8-oxo-dGTP pyrophosphatase MutT (NUDIX family)